MRYSMIKCAGPCGEILPGTRKNFRFMEREKQFSKTCLKCEAAMRRDRRAHRNTVSQDDAWARLYITKLQRQMRGTDISAMTMPASVLSAIMKCQRYADHLTKVPFRLPDGADLIHYKGWEQWRESLTATDRLYTPVLVRVTMAGPWAVGNVLFMSSVWANMREECRDGATFKEMCYRAAEALPTMSVPSPELIEQVIIADRIDRSKRNNG